MRLDLQPAVGIVSRDVSFVSDIRTAWRHLSGKAGRFSIFHRRAQFQTPSCSGKWLGWPPSSSKASYLGFPDADSGVRGPTASCFSISRVYGGTPPVSGRTCQSCVWSSVGLVTGRFKPLLEPAFSNASDEHCLLQSLVHFANTSASGQACGIPGHVSIWIRPISQ